MKKPLIQALLFIISLSIYAAGQDGKPELLIRCDDIGMSHSANLALAEMIQTNIPFSASVMFTCPWYQEAVEMLKDNPQVAVGIHLTLNAEWKNYRWGPVLGMKAVPSLVDSCGYFFPHGRLSMPIIQLLKILKKNYGLRLNGQFPPD